MTLLAYLVLLEWYRNLLEGHLKRHQECMESGMKRLIGGVRREGGPETGESSIPGIRLVSCTARAAATVRDSLALSAALQACWDP